MTVIINGQTQIKSQTLVNFPPQPALNLNFTQGYANGLNPLPSTVTFTRADASAIATQIGPDGLLRLAAHNIVVNSGNMTATGWSAVHITATATTTTVPDGTTTAYKLGGSIASSNAAVYQTTSAAVGTYTWSVYAKADGANFLFMFVDGGAGDAGAYFDLSSGAIGNTVGSIVSRSIIPVGNSWFRCQVTAVTSAATIYPALLPSTTNATGRSSQIGTTPNGVLVWGAQLEKNLTPSYYVPTTSAAVYANTPRFDYDPVTTEPKGLLIEEARTNARTQSNAFTNAVWSTVAATAAAANFLAPDGTTNSFSLTEDTSTNRHIIYPNAAGVANGSVAASIYAKNKGRRYINMTYHGTSGGLNQIGAVFDLQAGVVTYTPAGFTATITPAGNDWYRCSIVVTQTTDAALVIALSNRSDNSGSFSLGSPSYTGDGVSGVYLYGAQFEVGSFPTSYIPTTTASVTRAVESATMTGTNFSSWWNATNGTLYFEGASNTDTGSAAYCFSADDGTTVNNSIYGFCNGAPVTYRIYRSTSLEVDIAAGNRSQGVKFKLATVYKANDASASLNGASAVTDTSVTLPTVDRLNIGRSPAGQFLLNGYVSKLQYWPARFSNAQLQLITKG